MPWIYPTYVNSSGDHIGLESIRPLGANPLHLQPNPTLFFLANSPAGTLLVKLVPPQCCGESRGEAVHHMLAEGGLSPLLLGTAHVAGAPSAIVMEHLDGTSGWTTLHDYVKNHQDIPIDTSHPGLAKLLETMKSKGVVHGDLRPNNIMCRVQPGEGELEIRVIDFDWAGKVGVARYPAVMNPHIPWPGKPRELIGENDDETLLSLTLAKLYTRNHPAPG